MAGKFEIFTDKGGEYRFRLEARQRRDHRQQRGLHIQGQREKWNRIGQEKRRGRHRH
jgi:hypothetical protein